MFVWASTKTFTEISLYTFGGVWDFVLHICGVCQLWKTSPNVSFKMRFFSQAAQNLYPKKHHIYSNNALCLKNYPQRLAARNLKNLHNLFKGELIFQLLLPTLGVKKLWVLRSRNHPLAPPLNEVTQTTSRCAKGNPSCQDLRSAEFSAECVWWFLHTIQLFEKI